ncbi:hypothetical protein THAOC_30461, partial [Thalassiosira oceanica]
RAAGVKRQFERHGGRVETMGRMIDQGVRKQKTQQEVDAWEVPNATA